MPWSDNSTIQSLRLQYNAALAGYRVALAPIWTRVSKA